MRDQLHTILTEAYLISFHFFPLQYPPEPVQHSMESVLLYQCIGNAEQDNEAEDLVRHLISNGADVNLANGVRIQLRCSAVPAIQAYRLHNID